MQDGELDEGLTHRVQSGWKILKRVSGVVRQDTEDRGECVQDSDKTDTGV